MKEEMSPYMNMSPLSLQACARMWSSAANWGCALTAGAAIRSWPDNGVDRLR